MQTLELVSYQVNHCPGGIFKVRQFGLRLLFKTFSFLYHVETFFCIPAHPCFLTPLAVPIPPSDKSWLDTVLRASQEPQRPDEPSDPYGHPQLAYHSPSSAPGQHGHLQPAYHPPSSSASGQHGHLQPAYHPPSSSASGQHGHLQPAYHPPSNSSAPGQAVQHGHQIIHTDHLSGPGRRQMSHQQEQHSGPSVPQQQGRRQAHVSRRRVQRHALTRLQTSDLPLALILDPYPARPSPARPSPALPDQDPVHSGLRMRTGAHFRSKI